MMAAQEEEYLTYQEAAERYGVGESTIRYWANMQRFKRYKKPRDKKAYLRVSDIEQYLHAEPTPKEDKS